MATSGVRPILVCTVGGSREPIVSSYRELEPGFICFLCTSDDEGNLGSVHEVRRSERTRTTTLPEELKLGEGSWDWAEVPHDDPDRAYAEIRTLLAGVRARFPRSRLVADFTGGTKSMSIGLFLAASERADIEPRFMAGSRRTLEKVESGTERPVTIRLDRILAERQITLLLDQWRSFGYAAAESGFRRLGEALRDTEIPPTLLQRIAKLQRASEGMAAWDRFAYGHAKGCLQSFARTSPECERLAALAKKLSDQTSVEPYVLWDLWRNAERRAARGQYDDAVSRLYRMIEWTAQWLLKRDCGIADTSKILLSQVPELLAAERGWAPEASIKSGLVESWMLVRALAPDGPAVRLLGRWTGDSKTAAAPAWVELESKLLQLRNYSFLAHGRVPIDEQKWQRFASFMTGSFLPMLVEEARLDSIELEMPQLPTEPPI